MLRFFMYFVGVCFLENNVEMTAPVLMKMETKGKNKWDRKYLSMSFLLPSAHQANPPSPADDKVEPL